MGDLAEALARCDREIERCKQEALSGNPDIHGILLGLHDWRTEKKLIEAEFMSEEFMSDNRNRPDHKLENRKQAGGKAY